MATCRIREIDEKYYLEECSREAWDQDPEGLCIFHSTQEDKDKDGAFTAAVKAKLKSEDFNFRGVCFPGPFSPAKLTGEGKFTFTKPADFSGATFQKADFSLATFKEADFSGATFKEEADFSGATFQERADFSWATFQERAYFLRATFKEKAYFALATFQKPAIFAMANFQGEALFVGLNTYTKGQPPDPVFFVNFRVLILGSEAAVVFRDVCLARVAFSGTDLRRLTFRHVDWHPYHAPALDWLLRKLPVPWCTQCRGRQAVYDEILLRGRLKGYGRRFRDLALKYGRRAARRLLEEGKKDEPRKVSQDEFARVEELYQGLKQNYEKVGDYKRVGDFHYGEMEMHRRGSFWRQWVPFSWQNLYRVLNGYGERPLLAFIWLLLLIPAWAGLVWGLGIDQAGSQDPVSYGNTLFFILEKALLQRPEWPKGITGLGKFLGSLSVLLLPGQAALFILALRNRLGRRR